MNNNYLHNGNLQLFSEQLLSSKMALRNGLFPVSELWFTRCWLWRSSPCHGQKYKKINKTSLILTDNPTCALSLSLEISFYADIWAPKRQQRTISPENAKTCWPVKFKDGGDAVFYRNRFNRHFSLNDPLTRFATKSQRQYSKLALLTSDYLILVRLLFTQWYLVRVSWSMVYIVLVKRGYFWCIMGALRDSSAPISPRFTTVSFLVDLCAWNEIYK